MRSVRAARTLTPVLAAGLLAWGCASRQDPRAAPGPRPQVVADPGKGGEEDANRREDDPAALEAELARSEASLGTALARYHQPTGVVSGNQPTPQKAPPVEDACSTACRALASMRRASERLCALTGAADERCAKARQRTQSAAARVKEACPSCSG